jgi:hypothetical protein
MPVPTHDFWGQWLNHGLSQMWSVSYRLSFERPNIRSEDVFRCQYVSSGHGAIGELIRCDYLNEVFGVWATNHYLQLSST